MITVAPAGELFAANVIMFAWLHYIEEVMLSPLVFPPSRELFAEVEGRYENNGAENTYTNVYS